MSKDPQNYDTRLIRHHVRRGELDRKQLDKRLAELPDDAEHAVETEARFEPTRRS